jgi:hypothetical protein
MPPFTDVPSASYGSKLPWAEPSWCVRAVFPGVTIFKTFGLRRCGYFKSLTNLEGTPGDHLLITEKAIADSAMLSGNGLTRYIVQLLL